MLVTEQKNPYANSTSKMNEKMKVQQILECHFSVAFSVRSSARLLVTAL